jgi:hypothetical protein
VHPSCLLAVNYIPKEIKMSIYHDDDDGKPTWREIDRKKEKSYYGGEDRKSPKSIAFIKYDKENMMKKAEEFLFKGKKAGYSDEATLREKIGTPEFNKAAISLVDNSGIPEDWHVLFMLLDVKNDEIVRKVAETMKAQYDRRSATEKQVYKSKLRILSMTSRNSETKEFMQEMLGGLES